MLTRSTSPLRNQQHGNETSISSKGVSHSAVARKLPGTFLIKDKSLPLCDRCEGVGSHPHIDNEVGTNILEIAAHDLRHPAAVLVTLSELLTESVGHTMSDENTELINSIRSVSQFMIRLLDDTLDFAGARAGTVQLRTAPSNLSAVVEQSIEMSRLLATKKNMRLDFVQEGEPLPVLLDAVKISKVFNNLIDNAIRYCQPGASIAIRISRSSDRVLISVRDDGPGIDPSALKTLFNPFQRTRSRASDEEPRTGLGLAIAHNIVHLHGGRMHVKSRVGQGTTFYVTLPAQSHQSPRKS
jgi:signal transduction histidine kinase